MKRRTDPAGTRSATLLKLIATSAAFFLTMILAAAYANASGTPPPPTPPDLTISKSTGGIAANGTSDWGFVSSDGNTVVFQSMATNLGPVTPTLGNQVFVRDVLTEQTSLISNWQDGFSAGGTITVDGLHVVYWDREFLDPTIGPWTLFVRDLQAGTDENVGQGYVALGGGYTAETSASGDAQQIAFRTEQALDPADTNGVWDIYLKDRVADTLTRVSVPAGGGAYDDVHGLQLSVDAQWIVFNAKEQGAWNVVLKQLSPPGQEFKFPGSVRAGSAMDAVGQMVAYSQSGAGVFVFDRTTGLHDLVSIDSLGNPGAGDCGLGVISGDGISVAFHCEGAMTSHGALEQVYVRDIQQGLTKLASITSTGAPGSFYSIPNSIPFDGSSIVLQTGAFNLHSGGASEQIVRIPSSYWDEGCANDDTTCDGVDDDCSGENDEDYAPQDTNCGLGACAAEGETSCDSGQVVDSCVPGTSAGVDSLCDGVDENCNGTVDEDAVEQFTCQIAGCSAMSLGPCGSISNCPSEGVCISEADCADTLDNDIDGLIDCWDPDCATSLDCPNTAPTLSPVAPEQVTAGKILRLTLVGADADSDPITFSATPLPLLANATLQGDTGEFVFAPTLTQVGSYALNFSVSDGRDVTTQTTVITVLAPVPGAFTEVTGFVYDAVEAAGGDPTVAVVGATVRDLGSPAFDTTAIDGSFTLTGLTPGQVTLEFDGSTAIPPPPPLDTIFGSYRATVDVESETTLELSQHVFLPYIDEDASVDYDPGSASPAVLTNTDLAITIEIQPNSIEDEFGNPITEMTTLTLSSVPPEFTPGALPDTLNPSMVITIQPMGLTFSEPAPITFPNNDGLSPGSEVDIWSLNHSTGEFEVAGQGQVTPDGTQITTIPGTGGIVETSWHFPGPPGPGGDGGDDGTGDGSSSDGGDGGDDDPGDPPEPDPCDKIGSSMPLGKGKIRVNINLPSYKVLSDPVTHELVYDSSRAFPYYLLPVSATVPGNGSIPPIMSYDTTVGGAYSNDRRYVDTSGLQWGVQDPFRIVAGVDATDQETSLVPVDVRITSHYEEARYGTVVKLSLVVINGRNSPFGAGWGWSGLRRLVPVGAGGADRLMVDGSGGYRLFRFVTGAFVSPDGDASTLVANPDGSITLMRIDGVETHFDVDGAQERVAFPNGNVWQYNYDPEGRLSSIVDPIGGPTGTTTIHYEGEFISEVIDPAQRKTEFEHDSNGDLILVRFPDGSERKFGYDHRHLMESETSVRDFDKHRIFDFAGRLVRVVLEDDSERRVVVAATQGFIPPYSSFGLTKETAAPFTGADRVTIVEDAESRSQSFEVGAYGKIIKMTETPDLVTILEYDDAGNLKRIERPNGQAFFMEYDSNKNVLTRKDEVLNSTTTFTYEPLRNKLETRKNQLGDIVQLQYYPNGNLKKVISPAPNLRELNITYYPDGNVETITDPLSRVARFDYDPNGNIKTLTVTPSSGSPRITSFVNTGPGYPEAITNPLFEALTIVRDEWNRPTSLTDHAQQTTGIFYDVAGNLRTVTPPLGQVHALLYDERDWNTAYVPPELMGQDVRTSRERNREEQLKLENLAGDRPVSYGYDTAGRLETVTIERGIYTAEYSPTTGQLRLLTDPAEGSLLFAFDGDRLKSVRSYAGNSVSYSYDPLGRLDVLSAVTIPGASGDPSSMIATWPGEGNLVDPVGGFDAVESGGVSYVPGIDGQAFSFDGLLDGLTANVPLDGRTSATFALWVRMDQGTNVSGERLLWVRRRNGLTDFELQAGGDGLEATFMSTWAVILPSDVVYDDGQWHHVVFTMEPILGQLTFRLYFDGAGADTATTFNIQPFDTIGDLLIGGVGASRFEGDIDDLAIYDRALSPEEITDLYAKSNVQVDYNYDADGAVIQAGDVTMSHYPATGLLETISLADLTKTYTYTGFGEILTESTEVGATLTNVYQVSYDVYDPLGRVSQKTEVIEGGVTVTYDYAYDAAGRLEDVLVEGGLVEHYTYDDNGNRLTALGVSPITYDVQDRLERYGDNVYAYRDSGELWTKTNPDGQTTYDYDEFGNLLSVVLPGNSVVEYEVDALDRRVGRRFDGEVTRRWIYEDQLNPVAELAGDGNIVALFIYGTRRHVPDAMIKNDTRYLLVTDYVGSVRLVVNAETGAVVQRIDYDSWGNVLSDSSPGFQPFGFAGGLYDQNTKLLRFGERDYDPEVGRWTVKDPILFEGGQSNLYVYVGNDPINYIDETGTFLGPYLPPIPLPVGPLPAAVAAAYFGDQLGQAIDERFGDDIQDLLDDLLRDDETRDLLDEMYEGGPCEKEPEQAAKRKPREDNKPNRKRQGREGDTKNRKDPKWKPFNKRPPREPPSHTPSKKD